MHAMAPRRGLPVAWREPPCKRAKKAHPKRGIRRFIDGPDEDAPVLAYDKEVEKHDVPVSSSRRANPQVPDTVPEPDSMGEMWAGISDTLASDEVGVSASNEMQRQKIPVTEQNIEQINAVLRETAKKNTTILNDRETPDAVPDKKDAKLLQQ